MARFPRAFVAVLCVAVLSIGVDAQGKVKFGFVDELVAEELDIPVDIKFIPGSSTKFLVLEKWGRVRLVVDGKVRNKDVFDMRSRSNSYWDRAALSLHLDVDFRKGTRYAYVFHAYENDASQPEAPKTGQVTRFTIGAGTVVVPGSDKVILGTVTGAGCNGIPLTSDVVCCDSFTHCVGDVVQDKSGSLYVSIGDGAYPRGGDPLAMRSQDINALNGKILRIDREGQGVAGNPWFTGNAGENRSKVWALGARNSWRMSWDATLGAPWTAEVGWSTFEEINLNQRGTNGGWPCEHGDQMIPAFAQFTNCQSGVYPNTGVRKVPPYFYDRSIGTAASGALRINFKSWPSKYRNKIYTSDYIFSYIKYFGVDGSGNRKNTPKDFATSLNGPVRLLAGNDDCLWYVTINANQVRKICYSPDGTPPKVVSAVPPPSSQLAETTSTVVIQFSKAMRSSVTKYFSMVRVADGAAVGGSLVYDDTTFVLTFKPTSALGQGTQYRYAVRGRADDPAGRRMGQTYEAIFTTGTGSSIYLSDLGWVSSRNACGPVERDRMNGGGGSGDGGAIRMKGVTYAKGIGLCSDSEVVIDIPAGCTRFQAVFGIADEVGVFDVGRIIGRVYMDGAQVFATTSVNPEPLNRGSDDIEISVDTGGASRISLVVSNGGESDQYRNRAAWADARFRCGGFDGEAPRVLRSKPAKDTKKVPINVKKVVLTFSEPMERTSVLSAVRLRVGEDEIGWSPSFSQSLDKLTMEVEDLAYDTKHTIVVSRDARDLAGNKLKKEFVATFRTRIKPATGEVIPLSELVATTSNAGFLGPSTPVRLRVPSKTVSYRRGIGMKPAAQVVFKVPTGCIELEGWVGIDASTEGKGSCNLSVKDDTKAKFFRRLVNGGQAPWFFSVTVKPDTKIHINAQPTASRSDSDMCNWAELRFRCDDAVGGDRWLNDLKPKSRMGTVKFNRNANGKIMTLGDRSAGSERILDYDDGVLMKAGGRALYPLPGRCSRFLAEVGIAEDAGPRPDFKVLVKTSNLPLCSSPRIQRTDAPAKISCRLNKSDFLQLEAKDTDGDPTKDLAGLGGARVDCEVGTREPKCEFDEIVENFKVGDTIRVGVSAYDFLGRPIPKSKVELSMTQIHCSPCHEHLIFRKQGATSLSHVVEDHGDTFYYQVKCKVCDGKLCTTASANSFGKSASITVESDPPGLQIGVDSKSGPSPLMTEVMVGAKVQLSTIQTQGSYAFQEWTYNPAKAISHTKKILNGTSQKFVVKFRPI